MDVLEPVVSPNTGRGIDKVSEETSKPTFDDYLKAQRFHSRWTTLAIWVVLLTLGAELCRSSGDYYFIL